MKTRFFHFVTGVSILALAAMACGLTAPGSSAPTDRPSATPTQRVQGGNGNGNVNGNGLGNNNDGNNNGGANPASNRPLLNDDFRGPDTHWGTGADADRAVQYVNDALQFLIFATNLIVYSGPNDTDYENVHIEVTAVNSSADPNAGFGILCNQQFMDDEFYYGYITASGDYGIVKSMFIEDNINLATGFSDLIPQNAPSYRIGLDCGNGTIALYVNGQKIDSVADPDYASGHVGLLAFSNEIASGVSVSFDDFIVTALP
ncbi:MAG: hypothetical protein AB1750_14525 [Chloroflexota bacterium]